MVKDKSPHKAGSCLSIRQDMACATSRHPPGREDVGFSMPVRVPVARRREALESSRRRAGLFWIYLRFFLTAANCSTNSLCRANFFFASLTMCS